jgi:hypothetical protein
LHCCLLLELDCFRNLPIQQYTILAFISTLCGIPSSLSTCWTLDILVNTQSTSICNRHNFLFQHLAELVRPLMVLSFNSPKPTKGLDALSQGPHLSCLASREIRNLCCSLYGYLLTVLFGWHFSWPEFDLVWPKGLHSSDPDVKDSCRSSLGRSGDAKKWEPTL